jgi:CreA protein
MRDPICSNACAGSAASRRSRNRQALETQEANLGGHWREDETPLSCSLPAKRTASKLTMAMLRTAVLLAALVSLSPAHADSQDPDLIFRKSTTFKLLTPNDKLAVYGIDDPVIDGIACHYTIPEKGGLSGALGLAEQTSDISLACNQYGPIKFKAKFSQGDVVFSESRSLFFKKMQIVRGCDTKRNMLVYMTYSDKLVEGSPKNSTSSVPIEPWGLGSTDVQKCADFLH